MVNGKGLKIYTKYNFKKKKIKNIVIDTEDTSAMAAHGVLP